MQTIKMYRISLIISSLLILIFGTIGCGHNTQNNQVAKTSHTVSNTEKKITLKTITSNSVSSNKAQIPEQVITNGIEWTFSDGNKSFPSKKSFLWSKKFNKQMIAVIKVSRTSEPEYNLVCLTFNQHQWEIKGFIDAPINKDDLYTEKKGLDLPMQKFAIANLTLEPKKKNIWFFANKNKFIVIGKFPREAFSLPSGFQQINLNGKKAWVNAADNNFFLYYFENENIVWIGGKLSEDEIRKVALSLPLVGSSFFPFQKP